MWLQMILIYKPAEEMTNRQAETTLEVGDENYSFSIFRLRRQFSTGQPTLHPGGNPPRLDQPINFLLGDPGTLLGSAARARFGILFVTEVLLLFLLRLIVVFCLTVSSVGGAGGGVDVRRICAWRICLRCVRAWPIGARRVGARGIPTALAACGTFRVVHGGVRGACRSRG